MTVLVIRLQPGASLDRIDGWDTDTDGRPVLKCRVRARPVEGEANAALVGLLSKALGVRKSAVEITRGGQSRTKAVMIDGLSNEAVRERLTSCF